MKELPAFWHVKRKRVWPPHHIIQKVSNYAESSGFLHIYIYIHESIIQITVNRDRHNITHHAYSSQPRFFNRRPNHM